MIGFFWLVGWLVGVILLQLSIKPNWPSPKVGTMRSKRSMMYGTLPTFDSCVVVVAADLVVCFIVYLCFNICSEW